jgi:hypothetical protein
MRETAGNVPAWKAPKEKRSTSRTPKTRTSSRGNSPTRANPAVSVEPPRMMTARIFLTPSRSPSNPQGISKTP